MMRWGSHALILEPVSLWEEIRMGVEKMVLNFDKMIPDREEVFGSDRRG